MKTTPNDYLKFWRVIRYYMKAKHGLSQADLDIILFLYSEGYFGRETFDGFAELVSWEVGRFIRLQRAGWITYFRKRRGKSRALYQLSDKANRVVLDIYRKLNGEEIPTSMSANPMFLICFVLMGYLKIQLGLYFLVLRQNMYQLLNQYF